MWHHFPLWTTDPIECHSQKQSHSSLGSNAYSLSLQFVFWFLHHLSTLHFTAPSMCVGPYKWPCLFFLPEDFSVLLFKSTLQMSLSLGFRAACVRKERSQHKASVFKESTSRRHQYCSYFPRFIDIITVIKFTYIKYIWHILTITCSYVTSTTIKIENISIALKMFRWPLKAIAFEKKNRLICTGVVRKEP